MSRIPGYGGYTPGEKFEFGKSYGKTTLQLGAGSFSPNQSQQSNNVSAAQFNQFLLQQEQRAASSLSNNPTYHHPSGYGGHVPNARNVIGTPYGEISAHYFHQRQNSASTPDLYKTIQVPHNLDGPTTYKTYVSEYKRKQDAKLARQQQQQLQQYQQKQQQQNAPEFRQPEYSERPPATPDRSSTPVNPYYQRAQQWAEAKQYQPQQQRQPPQPQQLSRDDFAISSSNQGISGTQSSSASKSRSKQRQRPKSAGFVRKHLPSTHGHVMPGYGGHVPTYTDGSLGRTYGSATRDILYKKKVKNELLRKRPPIQSRSRAQSRPAWV